MCGIGGLFGEPAPDAAAAMSGAMAHRGPDDSGRFENGRLTLVHRRLSIIDVSASGHQPMPYANGRYQIAFNGEIYNFAALRVELETLGHTFTSHSDTEVLLAGWAQWGEDCVRRLRGMFAFALYDSAEETLFLARDRFGIKPLYFTTQKGTFIFASELKALLASGLVPRQLDPQALWFYLSLGSVPQPGTAIAGVKMLAPGHTMTIRRELSATTARYWDLAEASRVHARELRGIDGVSAARELRVLLDEATRLHMVADVPVGAFLSGGIDSTAVVGLMTRASGRRISTFSVGFAEDQSAVDEREWARLAARTFDSEHHEVLVTGAEVAAQFDDLVRAIDQPSLDGTNTYLVSQATSRSLNVALSGIGGDELFAGYQHFRRMDRAANWDRRLAAVPSPLRRGILRKIPGRFLADRDLLLATLPERYATMRRLVDDREKPGMLNGDMAARTRMEPLTALYDPFIRAELDGVAQTSYVESSRYMADTLLRDADAMSMRWSLEVRPVLLDHVLAEFVLALPSRLKLTDSGNKSLFVDAVRDLLPPGTAERKKLGFELPLQSWLSGPLKERVRSALASDQARSIFSERQLKSTRDDLDAGRRPALRVWSHLIFVEWMRSTGVTP